MNLVWSMPPDRTPARDQGEGMTHVAELQRILHAWNLMLMIVLLLKLHAAELSRRYRFFSLYLLFEILCAALLIMVNQRSTTYALIWICSKPLSWVLSLLVLLEIYALVMAQYPGIASLMRWAVGIAALLALVLSVSSLSLDFQNPHEQYPLLRYSFAVQRTVDATQALSVLAALLFMAQFPVRLCRNVIAHCLLFSGMAGTEAGCLFARNWLGADFNPLTNLFMTSGTMLCLLCWIWFVNRQGEEAEQVVGPMCSPEMELRLLKYLHACNEMLVRSGRLGKAAAL
jgi:hypothetical protein